MSVDTPMTKEQWSDEVATRIMSALDEARLFAEAHRSEHNSLTVTKLEEAQLWFREGRAQCECACTKE